VVIRGIKTTTSPQICWHTTFQNVSVHLYNFTFISATIICVLSGGSCFTVHLLIYFFFLLLTPQYDNVAGYRNC